MYKLIYQIPGILLSLYLFKVIKIDISLLKNELYKYKQQQEINQINQEEINDEEIIMIKGNFYKIIK